MKDRINLWISSGLSSDDEERPTKFISKIVPTIDQESGELVIREESKVEVLNNKSFQQYLESFKSSYLDEYCCAITGKPAKYFDPLTQCYFSNINSFLILRQLFEISENEFRLEREC